MHNDETGRGATHVNQMIDVALRQRREAGMQQPDPWMRSSFCDNSGSCVEFAKAGNVIKLRDGKLGDESPVLAYDSDEWQAFRQAIVAGEI